MAGAALTAMPAVASATPGIDEPSPSSTGATPWDSYTTPVAANPAFPDSCGLDATLSIDVSGSMSTADVENAKVAAQAVVDALRGTDSTVRILTFAYDSPASNGNPNSERLSVNTDYQELTDHIGQLRTTFGGLGNGTRWDRVLEESMDDPGNVNFLITDGGFGNTSPSTSFNASRDEAWMVPANTLKNSGTRMVPIAVGDEFMLTKPASETRAWMPPFWFMVRGADGLTQQNRDYYHAANTSLLTETLVEAATQSCVGSVNLTSYVDNGTSNVLTPGFEYATTGAGVNVTPETTTVTTDAEATASIEFTGGPGTATITQAARTGYTLDSVSCRDNLTNTPVAATVTGNAFTVPVSEMAFLTCDVVNVAAAVDAAPGYDTVQGNPGDELTSDQTGDTTMPDGVEYAFAGEVPAGMTIDAETGEITWSVPADQALDTYTVDVTITYADGSTETVPAEFIITEPSGGSLGSIGSGSLGSITGSLGGSGSLGSVTGSLGNSGSLVAGALGSVAIGGGIVWAIQNGHIQVPPHIAAVLPQFLLDLLGIDRDGNRHGTVEVAPAPVPGPTDDGVGRG